jgi:hypothetical protein
VAQAGLGQRDAALVAQAAERHQVVVARYAGAAQLGHAPHGLVGQRPVADEIARAQVAVELLGGEEGQGRLEGVQVGVDV